ncbi:hypothetical protein D3C87_1520090 [compost metagenome]
MAGCKGYSVFQGSCDLRCIREFSQRRSISSSSFRVNRFNRTGNHRCHFSTGDGCVRIELGSTAACNDTLLSSNGYIRSVPGCGGHIAEAFSSCAVLQVQRTDQHLGEFSAGNIALRSELACANTFNCAFSGYNLNLSSSPCLYTCNVIEVHFVLNDCICREGIARFNDIVTVNYAAMEFKGLVDHLRHGEQFLVKASCIGQRKLNGQRLFEG